jgi:hypothetical protein
MRKFVSWLARVSAWVWLLLACTQLLNVVARSREIIGLLHDIPGLPEQEAWDGIRATSQRMLWDDEVQLVVSIVALLVFTAFALVRLMTNKREREGHEPFHPAANTEISV